MTNRDNIFYDGLCAIQEVFYRHGITYWLEAGSLIGAMRESKVLDWDKDADVSFFEEDVEYILKNKAVITNDFKELGYEFGGQYRFGIRKYNRHIACIMPVRIVDGFIVKVKRNDYLKEVRARVETLGNFAYIKMQPGGEMMPVPQYPEDYLQFRFSDWQTPVKYEKNSIHGEYSKFMKHYHKCCIFPGRFDPPNLGHILTITHLLKQFELVYIGIYDTDSNWMEADKKLAIFKEIFGNTKKVRFFFFTESLITRTYFGDLPGAWYIVSGNKEILANCKRNNYPSAYVKRTPGYCSTAIRNHYRDKTHL